MNASSFGRVQCMFVADIVKLVKTCKRSSSPADPIPVQALIGCTHP